MRWPKLLVHSEDTCVGCRDVLTSQVSDRVTGAKAAPPHRADVGEPPLGRDITVASPLAAPGSWQGGPCAALYWYGPLVLGLEEQTGPQQMHPQETAPPAGAAALASQRYFISPNTPGRAGHGTALPQLGVT